MLQPHFSVQNLFAEILQLHRALTRVYVRSRIFPSNLQCVRGCGDQVLGEPAENHVILRWAKKFGKYHVTLSQSEAVQRG